MEKLLTTKEAAEYLRMSPQTLRTRRTKKLPPKFMKAEGLKGKVLYSLEDLNNFMDIKTGDNN